MAADKRLLERLNPEGWKDLPPDPLFATTAAQPPTNNGGDDDEDGDEGDGSGGDKEGGRAKRHRAEVCSFPAAEQRRSASAVVQGELCLLEDLGPSKVCTLSGPVLMAVRWLTGLRQYWDMMWRVIRCLVSKRDHASASQHLAGSVRGDKLGGAPSHRSCECRIAERAVAVKGRDTDLPLCVRSGALPGCNLLGAVLTARAL